MISSIFKYREFIYSCVKREFQMKYKGSMLGILWAVVQPLAIILVYTVVFSEIMKSKLSGMENMPFAYSLYLCSGILTWNLFTEIINRCVNIFLENANLMKKVMFPRICLPIIAVTSSVFNFLIAFLLFLLFLVVIGKFPVTIFYSFFLVLFVQVLFSVVLGVGLGVLNVFFRDVGHLMTLLLQFWFWFTPVVYPVNIIPEKFQQLMLLNPMYYIVHSYQDIFVYTQTPSWSGVLGVFLVSVLIGFFTLRLYRKHVGEMVDEL